VLSDLHEAKEPALREARFVPDRTMYITLFFDVEESFFFYNMSSAVFV
jgi:hypothetical protein